MYPLLNSFSDCIYGVDPDLYAINRAKKYNYELLNVGHAESIPFESNIFDFVFCWAAFDVIPHCLGINEMNRVLKLNGFALITGKNHDYYENDSLALIAEKNAYTKGFPNKFTDLVALIKNAKNLGFKINHLITFPKRGDFGGLNYIQINPNTFLKNPIKCYEYLIILEKIGSFINTPVTELDYPISKTALNLRLFES
jgi:SAM-dependent methyltransferase